MARTMTVGEARKKIRGAFVASALEARREVALCDRVMEAADVHKWLLARVEGGNAVRPLARKFLK